MITKPVSVAQSSTLLTPAVQNNLAVYATKLLSQINNGGPLKPNQKLRINAYSDHLPLVYKILETAYRDFHSRQVSVDLKEQELEELKQSYGITEDFDYVELGKRDLIQQGAAFLTFENDDSPYIKAGLTRQEIKATVESICKKVSASDQRLLDVDPEEILIGCLDLRKGQPLEIRGCREHLPQILKLAEWAYANGTRLIDVDIEEEREFDLEIPFYMYASDAVLNEVSNSTIACAKESLEKNVADLILDGDDPNKYEGIDPERMQQRNSVVSEAVKLYYDRSIVENPWCLYYLPTTALALAAGYSSLHEAALEVKGINHTGKLKEHIAKLREITDKLNTVVKDGYRTLYFISVKPDTEMPDGQTNLKVGLTPKSKFSSVSEKTLRGQTYIANVPSEESFTTPDSMKTNGTVTMTKPISMDGTIIDGIKMEFKDGKVVKASATKNKEALLKWIEKNENADRMGEVALVAGSPIFDLGRIFNNILLDENATCHFALGSSYSECIEGAHDIVDYDERKKYLDALNCNDSPVHIDFMIGGPDVMVFAEKEDGSKKLLIKDNKFQI